MIRIVAAVLLMSLCILCPSPVDGQIRPGGPPGERQGRQELERRVMQGLARRMQEQLGLSQEEWSALQETMQSFREDRRALAMDQASLRHQLRDPALAEISQDEAREILSEMVRVQEDELALYRKEQDELLKVLSPAQLVQFYRVRDEFGRRIQELRQGRGGGGPPGDGITSWGPGGRSGGTPFSGFLGGLEEDWPPAR